MRVMVEAVTLAGHVILTDRDAAQRMLVPVAPPTGRKTTLTVGQSPCKEKCCVNESVEVKINFANHSSDVM